MTYLVKEFTSTPTTTRKSYFKGIFILLFIVPTLIMCSPNKKDVVEIDVEEVPVILDENGEVLPWQGVYSVLDDTINDYLISYEMGLEIQGNVCAFEDYLTKSLLLKDAYGYDKRDFIMVYREWFYHDILNSDERKLVYTKTVEFNALSSLLKNYSNCSKRSEILIEFYTLIINELYIYLDHMETNLEKYNIQV